MSKRELELGLCRAAGRGNEEKVTQLIQQRVDVNCAGFNEDTPLHRAASGGHVGVAKLLLNARAQVDIRNQRSTTCLLMPPSSVSRPNADVVPPEAYNESPLHKAASGGHVGVAELLLNAGAGLDSRDEHGETPEDLAASTDVSYGCDDKDRVLEGRKKILELFAAEKKVARRKVGPEGGELQTTSCAVTVPRGAVTMETEITCQVIDPNDVTLPLKDGEMLLSDIIELGPHGTTFHKPATVQIQYSSASLGGATKAVVWVTEDRSQWTELKRTTEESKGKLSVSVDHFSIFAVISQPKQDRFNVPSEVHTMTSTTQPAVQISFPEQAVNTPTQVKLARPEDYVVSTATEATCMIMTDLTAEPQHDTNPWSRCCMWIVRCCGRAAASRGQEYLSKESDQGVLQNVGVRKYFFYIKENVSSNWKDLSFHLGFNTADEDNIAGRNRDDKDRCMDMLKEWKKKKGDAATIEVLMEALSEAGLQSVVDGLKRKFPDIVHPPAGVTMTFLRHAGEGSRDDLQETEDPDCYSSARHVARLHQT
ncbi:positive regulation of extrinsic apoptotic signaling pathway via death domain receptors protein [Branchiostoma belcheri]|nr:positive regulation of extrinsic apoptotic signaling pathway via death domain receptors protein [Branchiostoma belcheri]